jgi:SpoVK/Ycf46/Vps4 family AAA+-type ATPase
VAKSDQIKKLIASFGRPAEFRAAALRIIEDAHRMGHMPMATALKRTLDAHVRIDDQKPHAGLLSIDQLTDPTAELVDTVEPLRTLTDIVLSIEARASFDRLIEEQKRADELRRHRLPVRSKVLLCGPPGCGKTMGAEIIARELNLPLLITKIDVLISSLLGQTATNLRRLFEFAGRSPAVLFLDEFDALARTRSDTGEHNELRRVVSSLLSMIERYQSRGVLIAATNLDGSLDPAIWRRFDDVIFFEPPKALEVRSLLELVFKNFSVNFEIEGIVSKLVGLSYADIERIAFDAIKTAVLRKRKAVTETDFAAAIKAQSRRTADNPRSRRDR